MARRSTTTKNTPDTTEAPETTGATADDGHMDFNDPETGAGHDAGGDDGLGPDAAGEPEAHDDKHADDGKPEQPEGPNADATHEALTAGPEGAEPEKVYDEEAAKQDTDNTHEDGNNGLHQEEYVSGDDATELARAEAEHHLSHDTGEDTSLHSGDVGRRINLSSETMVHSTLAPANRDETVVGDHPEREKGLRPLGPLDGLNRTDDAGRPYTGDSLHTAEKGLPVGQGVIEHVPAATASGSVPEGILSARAPVPVSGHERDPARFALREARSTLDTMLGDAEHRFLDLAEDMRIKGAVTFTLSQIGATLRTAETLVSAGFLKAEKALGGDFFPNGNEIYSLLD